jgi:hypothetical protein
MLPPEAQDRFYEFAFAMERRKANASLMGLSVGVAIGIAFLIYALMVN